MQEVENQATENSEVVVVEPIIENETVEATETEDVAEDNPEKNVEAGDSGDDEDNERFPKKAERALERRNKKINKLRAEVAELRAMQSQPAQVEQVTNSNLPDGLSEPQEDDFDDYADYLEAKGEYKAERKYADKAAKADDQQAFESQQQWVQERAKYVDDRAAKAAEAIPELDGLYRENQDIIEGWNDAAKMAFLEADKPELAFYALVTEGKLEGLDGLSPTRIAREIALAEIRGEKLTKQRPVSNAPAPIKKARGSGTRSKTLDDMSPSELLKHLKSNKG